MSDKRFEKALEDLRANYNPPPETPREAIWEAVRGAAGAETRPEVIDLTAARRRSSTVRWLSGVAAAAALLVLGIGIGRMSLGTPDATVEADPARAAATRGDTGAGTEGAASGQGAFRVAAVSHLLKTESLLTMVRADRDAGRFDAAVSGWAGELLTETRLLMDSPAAEDPTMARLLEDLELILVQLAAAGGSEVDGDRGRAELELVNEGIERQDMLLRIQAVVPSGAGLVGA